MDDSIRKNAILYNPSIFYFIASALPIISTTICEILFYWRHSDRTKFFPLSYTVTRLPESRLFSVSINTSTWLTLPVFIFIHNIIKFGLIKSNKYYRTTKMLHSLSVVAAIFSFFSMAGFASITIKEQPKIHTVFLNTYCISTVMYFILVDTLLTTIKFSKTTINWTFDVLIVGVFTSLEILKCKEMEPHSSVVQHVALAFCFLKYTILYMELPPIGISFSKDSTKKMH